MSHDQRAVSVAVLKTEKGFVVRPAQQIVERGQTIEWFNGTAQPIEILLPSLTLAPGSRALLVANPLESVGFEVRADSKVTPGVYPYAVYSQEAVGFCAGESSPIMIIRD